MLSSVTLMLVLAQGVMMRMIFGVVCWDHMDMERLMMLERSCFPFCHAIRLLCVIHGLRRKMCISKLGNTPNLRSGVVLTLLL